VSSTLDDLKRALDSNGLQIWRGEVEWLWTRGKHRWYGRIPDHKDGNAGWDGTASAGLLRDRAILAFECK